MHAIKLESSGGKRSSFRTSAFEVAGFPRGTGAGREPEHKMAATPCHPGRRRPHSWRPKVGEGKETPPMPFYPTTGQPQGEGFFCTRLRTRRVGCTLGIKPGQPLYTPWPNQRNPGRSGGRADRVRMGSEVMRARQGRCAAFPRPGKAREERAKSPAPGKRSRSQSERAVPLFPRVRRLSKKRSWAWSRRNSVPKSQIT